MKVFNFSPGEYADQYRTNGFVNISNGVNPDFLEYAREQASSLIEAQKSLKEWEFKDKKQQSVFIPRHSRTPRTE